MLKISFMSHFIQFVFWHLHLCSGYSFFHAVTTSPNNEFRIQSLLLFPNTLIVYAYFIQIHPVVLIIFQIQRKYTVKQHFNAIQEISTCFSPSEPSWGTFTTKGLKKNRGPGDPHYRGSTTTLRQATLGGTPLPLRSRTTHTHTHTHTHIYIYIYIYRV